MSLLLLCWCAVTQNSRAEETIRPEASPSLFAEMDEARLQRLYRKFDERGDLFPYANRSQGRFARALDSIFRPEPIRIGGVEASFTVVTAIKRKNPLCLLNPLVINVSW